MTTRAKAKKAAPAPAAATASASDRIVVQRDSKPQLPLYSVPPTTRADIVGLRNDFAEAYQVLVERKNAILATKGSKERRQGITLLQADLVSIHVADLNFNANLNVIAAYASDCREDGKFSAW